MSTPSSRTEWGTAASLTDVILAENYLQIECWVSISCCDACEKAFKCCWALCNFFSITKLSGATLRQELQYKICSA